jgi:hypothetical protein
MIKKPKIVSLIAAVQVPSSATSNKKLLHFVDTQINGK